MELPKEQKVRIVNRIALTITFAASSAQAFAQTTAPAPADIVAQLQGVERKVVTLRVEELHLNEERLPPGASAWEPSNLELQGTAWLNGLPNSKERITLSKSVMEWKESTSPWAEQSLDIGFDGQLGRIAYVTGGAIGHTTLDHTAEILPSKPVLLTNRLYGFATGASFSIAYIRVGDKSLSDAFRVPFEKSPNAYSISMEKIGGVSAVKLSFGRSSRFLTTYLFDPLRGYSLLGHTTAGLDAAGHQEIWDQDTVMELSEVAPGIWYPTKASHEERTPGKPGWRMCWTYRAKRVVANDPAFSETDFKVPIPAGYHVFDRIKGIHYVAGMSPQELQRSIDNSLEGAKHLVDSGPTAGTSETGGAARPTSFDSYRDCDHACSNSRDASRNSSLAKRSRGMRILLLTAISSSAVSFEAKAAASTDGDRLEYWRKLLGQRRQRSNSVSRLSHFGLQPCRHGIGKARQCCDRFGSCPCSFAISGEASTKSSSCAALATIRCTSRAPILSTACYPPSFSI